MKKCDVVIHIEFSILALRTWFIGFEPSRCRLWYQDLDGRVLILYVQQSLLDSCDKSMDV